MTCRKAYDTDLTDPEWEQLEALVPLAKPGGRPPIHSRREILNGIFYAVRSGSAWKLLPHDLPPWRTVYHYFWSWRRNGTWQEIHDSIRASVRQAAGRHPEPSGAVVDSHGPLSRPSHLAALLCAREMHIPGATRGFGRTRPLQGPAPGLPRIGGGAVLHAFTSRPLRRSRACVYQSHRERVFRTLG